MQILEGGTKLKKFYLSGCCVFNQEMEELTNLMKQTPNILPNIVSIQWFDDYDYENRGHKQHKLLLETFRRTFPHAEVLS
jgi:hypothetical protein